MEIGTMTTDKTRGRGAVVYEVDVEVDSAIAADYRGWLREHVAEMLSLPGFTGATMYDVLEPAPSAGCIRLSVQYRLRNREALDTYLRKHAPRMRADGVARFGDRFRAQRRVLSALRR